MTGTTTGAATRLTASSYANETSFKPGWSGGPGRPRGSRNRIQADLASEILAAAADVGFLKLDDKGEPVTPGKGGLRGYLRYAAAHEMKTFLGLLARAIPYNVIDVRPTDDPIITREEALAQLKEHGLPVELLHILRHAPAPLDDGQQ
jgi:hypothetical protein